MAAAALGVAAPPVLRIATAAQPAPAPPPPASPSEQLLIAAARATTWTDAGVDVIQLEGPVTIQLDRATLTADNAVIWLSQIAGAPSDQQRAQVVLLGSASIRHEDATRSGERLLADAVVRGTIRITADDRVARNVADESPLFQQAQALRAAQPRDDAAAAPGAIGRDPLLLPPGAPRPLPPTTRPQPPAATQPAAPEAAPVTIRAEQIDTVATADGRLAAVVTGGVVLFQERPNGDFIELHAQRGVVFTTLPSIRSAGDVGQVSRIEQAVSAAYLEGDVRVTYTPGARRAGASATDQRLEADRVYYEFTTDRAVLTDAVLHTIDPEAQIPVIVRAETIRQLARTDRVVEYSARDVELSTSAFAVPSYSVRAKKAYVRQEDTARYGNRTTFATKDATLRAFGVPFFYLPGAGGSLTDRGAPLRGIALENSRGFGTGVITEWGLFETLGRRPPSDFDATYRLDYYSDRGPAAGLDAEYGGGFITDTTRQPWNFTGDFTAYAVYDDGEDNLGRRRARIEQDDEFRGRVRWEHQHFFPDDWQVQLRAAYVSDATFLEEWFEREFESSLPQETSAYFKRQKDTEAFTLLSTFQTNDFVTTSDLQQEQLEVERFPELGYHRVGDSLFDDRVTLVSNNTFSHLRFEPSSASLAEQGFGFNGGIPVFPGRPSLGLPYASSAAAPDVIPAVDDDWMYRGDLREELSFPFAAGELKVLPYLMGRYTGYSHAVSDDEENRLFGAAGVRVNTTFWKVDERPRSRMLDIHRVRHVVEPELHLFTSGTTVERSDLFIYDEAVDAIVDVSAAQLALRQRWQTKRGGRGRQRSVDFLVLNVEGNFFANQPPDEQLEPTSFRGLFFPSLPEASIPRNAINADALWRISDTTVLLADAQQNLDDNQFATGAVGFAAQRDERVSYYLGGRYVDELDSMIASGALEYELTRKYSLSFSQSYDFGDDEGTVGTTASLRRRFDRFYALFTLYYDAREDESGFRFALYPEGLGRGAGTDALGTLFGR
jgi:hypothetical protein